MRVFALEGELDQFMDVVKFEGKFESYKQVEEFSHIFESAGEAELLKESSVVGYFDVEDFRIVAV